MSWAGVRGSRRNTSRRHRRTSSSSRSTRSARIASGVYGGLPETTPTWNRLAGRGVTFMDATAHVPLTAPSHASILTGLYPPHHTLRDNGGFVLSPRSRTLAELLRAHGYHTAAFVRRTCSTAALAWRGDSNVWRSLPHLGTTSVVAGPAASWSRSGPRRRQLVGHGGPPLLSLGAPVRPACALRSAAGLRLAISGKTVRG